MAGIENKNKKKKKRERVRDQHSDSFQNLSNEV